MRTLLTRATRVLADSLGSRDENANAAAPAAAVARAAACTVEALEGRRLLSATYYVSPLGSDANTGTSADAPLKSIGKVNSLDLEPGDRVLFQAGKSFKGSLTLSSGDSGTARYPVVIGSYGAGRATIRTTSGRGIAITNAGGIRVENLNVVGLSHLDTNYGIKVATNSGSRRNWIRIDNVDISGFGQYGINVVDETPLGTAGFDDVRITNAVVHHNVIAGIKVHNVVKAGYSHTNVYVGHVTAHDNFGSALFAVSGSGIELSNVDGATVERSIAYTNGALGSGSVAIWAHDANRVTFQYNEAYDQHTTDEADGSGFGFDTNTSNSVMQYNWSHDNDGHGINLAQWRANDAFTDNLVRFNLIEGNGRKNGYGGISMWGRVLNTHVYNNTIYQEHLSTSAALSPNRGIRLFKSGTDKLNGGIRTVYPDNVFVRNNIIMATGGATLVEVNADVTKAGVDIRFEGNAYWTFGSPFVIRHGSSTYAGLIAWRRGKGQERFNGRDVGFRVDPRLSKPGEGWTVGDADALYTMTAYELATDSPLVGQSLPVGALAGTEGQDLGAGVLRSATDPVVPTPVPLPDEAPAPAPAPAPTPSPTDRPYVVSATTSAAKLTFTFSESVYETLSRGDIVVRNRALDLAVSSRYTHLEYDRATNTATLTFPGLKKGQVRPGTFTVRILARRVTDADGNRMAEDFVRTYTV